MSLYPSLEDMHVHKIAQAQHKAFTDQNAYPVPDNSGTTSALEVTNPSAPILYPGLGDFMGLELTNEMIAFNMPEYLQNTVVPSSTTNASSMIAPLSNQTVGLKRAQVTHGIREVVLCKTVDNKIGLRVKDINNGIFITLVCKDSPAAMVG